MPRVVFAAVFRHRVSPHVIRSFAPGEHLVSQACADAARAAGVLALGDASSSGVRDASPKEKKGRVRAGRKRI